MVTYLWFCLHPEPQTASGLHCYPASIAKHHGWLLEAGVRLQLLIHSDAQWDRCEAGKHKHALTSFLPILLHVLFLVQFLSMTEMVFLLISILLQIRPNSVSYSPLFVVMYAVLAWEEFLPLWTHSGGFNISRHWREHHQPNLQDLQHGAGNDQRFGPFSWG